jgi:hypothetical protein
MSTLSPERHRRRRPRRHPIDDGGALFVCLRASARKDDTDTSRLSCIGEGCGRALAGYLCTFRTGVPPRLTVRVTSAGTWAAMTAHILLLPR